MAKKNPKSEQDPYADWVLTGKERQPFLELGHELGTKHARGESIDGVRQRIVQEALTLVAQGFNQGAAEALEGNAK